MYQRESLGSRAGSAMAKKPNAVVAGDTVYAGIDGEDATRTPVSKGLVIAFDSLDQLKAAMQCGKVEFDVMRDDSGATDEQ